MKITKKMLAELRLGASDLKDPAKTLIHTLLDERKALRADLKEFVRAGGCTDEEAATTDLALGEDEE